MKNKIREFGNRRDDYNVALVYYAGHAIEIEGENFLLPTETAFESEEDVEDYAVSIQKILRYIDDKSNEVNILILDACRDNPFEINGIKRGHRKWASKNRAPQRDPNCAHLQLPRNR